MIAIVGALPVSEAVVIAYYCATTLITSNTDLDCWHEKQCKIFVLFFAGSLDYNDPNMNFYIVDRNFQLKIFELV